MQETGIFSILPPLISIALALITKEVYSSLFLGVLSGLVIYVLSAGESVFAIFTHLLDLFAGKIQDNSYMIIFLCLLWAVITLVGRSGGTAAYGKWAGERLKTRRKTLLATALLGVIIFIDDGFNCLTIGTVMRPVYDRQRISREKLAYILDATAAPVCIIAPVSSWAVAVASQISDQNGFNIFLATIPYNLYALLTITMVLLVAISGRDFGKMLKAEREAASAGTDGSDSGGAPSAKAGKGRVIDLVLPIIGLVIFAILGMAYVGGFFRGTPFTEAIGENPSEGLSLGAIAALVIAFVLYIPRKIMSPKVFIENIVNGIGTVIPPILILILSWGLGGVCREMIGTGEFISGFVSSSHISFALMPLIIYITASLMSFSMGTSWGTFGILIPIVTMLCQAASGRDMLIPCLGATLAGAVFGDHCSPISDTTILASTGADCVHIRHVETQMPYAVLVAIACSIGYLIIGFTGTPWIGLFVGMAALTCAFMTISRPAF